MVYQIERAHIRDLACVKPFWKDMVGHYHDIVAGQWPVRSPGDAWQRRHQEYMVWINEGTGVIFLARDANKEAVGYAALHFSASGSTFDLGDSFGELESLAIHADHRGKGLGIRLIEACRMELHKRDIAYWSLDTLVGDPRTHRLYGKAGFVPFMIRMVSSVDEALPTSGDGDSDLTFTLPVIPPRDRRATGTPAAPDDSAAIPALAAAASADQGAVVPVPGAVEGQRPLIPSGPAAADGVVSSAITAEVELVARNAREAARGMALLHRSDKDAALHAMADALVAHTGDILDANREDLERGAAKGMAEGLLDRLRLNEDRLEAIADALRHVAGLPDPIGEVVRGSTLPNGAQIRQIRVPLGVVGMIYEARPNVTVDAAGLGLKSGNAVILRGGSAAETTNAALVDVLRGALMSRGLPPQAVQLLDAKGHDAARALMRARGLVDVIIPRGGADLIATVVRESQVPVIETGSGNVHVYVDADADLDQAQRIVVNAKTQRPSVCNAAETLLVHAAVADAFLANVLTDLHHRGVVLYGDDRTRAVARAIGVPVGEATEALYATEFHALQMTVAVVADVDAAMTHVRRYTTGHTEAIVTENRSVARRWIDEVDAAVVIVNASTRFTDGGEFGMGAEIGISTQKLHARGPMALPELTSTKWILEGDGQIRT